MIHKNKENTLIWVTRDSLTNSCGVQKYSMEELSEELDSSGTLGALIELDCYSIILPEEWV